MCILEKKKKKFKNHIILYQCIKKFVYEGYSNKAFPN